MKNLFLSSSMMLVIILATLTGASNLMAQGVNMNRYITLTVKSGQQIRLELRAVADNTPIRIVSGNNKHDITVNDLWSGPLNYTADGTTMTIYGDIKSFDCSVNGEKVTDINVSNNTVLRVLLCSENALTALDVSNNKVLKILFCVGNKLDDCALDALFRSLPSREASDDARVYIKDGPSTNPGVYVCRTPIAKAKNWKILDYNYGDELEINNTTFTCTTSDLIETEQSVAVSLYPNPVENVLHIEAEGEILSVRIYNTHGTEVATAAGTKQIDLSSLPSGVYAVRIETAKGIGTQRVVKR